MGWKLSMLIWKGMKGDVKGAAGTIGLLYGRRKYKPIGKTTLGECLNPDDDDKLYIGNINDCTIISEANLPLEFFKEKKGFTEKMMSHMTIGGREIYAFVLNSVVNLWGYNMIKNEERIRCRCRTHDEGVLFEIGEPQKPEEKLLKKSVIVNGKRIYKIDEKEYNEHQVGEEYVFDFIEHVLGDRLENKMWDTEMTIFECVEKKGYEDVFKRVRNMKK